MSGRSEFRITDRRYCQHLLPLELVFAEDDKSSDVERKRMQCSFNEPLRYRVMNT